MNDFFDTIRRYFYREDDAILWALNYPGKTSPVYPARIHLEHSWHNVYCVDVLED